jgi:hypothetical protein
MTLVSYIQLFIAGALVCLAVNYYHLTQENAQLRGDVAGLHTAISGHIDTSRNDFGQMRGEIKTVILSEENSTELLRGELEKLRKEFKFTIKGIKDYTEVGTSTSIPIAVRGRDTLIIERMTEKPSKVYPIKGRYVGSLIAIGDSLVGGITFADTVKVVVSKGKRDKWYAFWKKRPIVTNAFLSNPDGSITNLKSIRTE